MGEMIKCVGFFNLKESSWWGPFRKQGGDKTRLARGGFKGLHYIIFSHFVCLNISKLKVLRKKKEASSGAATWRAASALPQCHQHEMIQLGPWTDREGHSQAVLSKPYKSTSTAEAI